MGGPFLPMPKVGLNWLTLDYQSHMLPPELSGHHSHETPPPTPPQKEEENTNILVMTDHNMNWALPNMFK